MEPETEGAPLAGRSDHRAPRPSGQARRGRARVEQGLEPLAAAGVPLPVPARPGETLSDTLVGLLATAIGNGRLAPGVRLPSTRALAAAAGVSRNSVLAAYAVLTERGLVDGRHGSGSYVRADERRAHARPVPAGAPWLERLAPVPRGTGGGEPALDLRLRTRPAAVLPAAPWRRAWQTAAHRRLAAGYGDPAGERRLRAALTDYLMSCRGVAASPADTVVTGGAAEALGLLLGAVVRAGDRVAAEEPGYPPFLRMARDRGAAVLPVPVDGEGLRVDLVRRLRPAPNVLLLTPAHQFPTAVPLSAARRRELLAWARQKGVLLIEDDYGGEFDTTGLPPLAALDRHGCVAYVGTLSRLLAPSLRVGCLVAPRPLATAVAGLRGATDSYLNLPVQQAVAELLATGEATRQLRRARRAVAARRAALRAAARPGLLRGLDSGLHVLLPTPDAATEAAYADDLRGQGLIADRLGAYWHGRPTSHGLLLDHAGVSPAELARVAEVLNRLPPRA
ncbi:PLP-dependent aminotransferase family protein [Streptomyces tremellae]|uniref:PLP-dependent aminotransferase family protein n=1 Tax=Streptomyces tremellae TaxID=1124239 RepID=A0ABP7F7C8_9ACTN